MNTPQQELTMLDRIRAMLTGSVPRPPIAELIGFDLTSVEVGRAVMRFEAEERHANPMGTLHGGVMCDIADAAMGMAYASTLGPGESFTTLELKINFLKPFWKGTLHAVGEVVKRGNTVGFVECNVRDDKGELIAKASSTCLTLKGAQAEGR